MSSTRVKSVLIVGSGRTLLDELASALARSGWICRRSRSPSECRAFLREIRPAVVLACAEDDELTGALVSELGATRFAEGIPLVALSADWTGGRAASWPVEEVIPDLCGIDRILVRLDAVVSAGSGS